MTLKSMHNSLVFRCLLVFVAFTFFFTIKSVNYDRYPLMGHLEEYAYLQSNPLKIEVCPKCFGLWLDEGELEHVKN